MHDRKHRISSMLDARSLGVYVNMFVCVCVWKGIYQRCDDLFSNFTTFHYVIRFIMIIASCPSADSDLVRIGFYISLICCVLFFFFFSSVGFSMRFFSLYIILISIWSQCHVYAYAYDFFFYSRSRLAAICMEFLLPAIVYLFLMNFYFM